MEKSLTSFYSFSDLPPEMQLEVIRSDPSLTRTMRRTHPTFRELSKYDFYRQYCFQNITEKEWRQYTSSKPSQIGFITKDWSQSYATALLITRKEQSYISLTIIGDEFNLNTDATVTNMSPYYGSKALQEYDIDLVTVSNIIQERLSCLGVREEYKRDYLLRILDTKYTTLFGEDRLKLLHLWFYLIINYEALGYTYGHTKFYDFTMSASLSHVLNSIGKRDRDEIQRFYQEVRSIVARL